MNTRVRHELLLMREEEECSMCDPRLLACGSGTRDNCPSVEMGVEVDNGDGSVDFMEGTEDGEDDGVVAAETRYEGILGAL